MIIGEDADHQDWQQIKRENWQGTVDDEVDEIPTPTLQSIQPGDYYDQHADLSIYTIEDGNPATPVTYKLTYLDRVEYYTEGGCSSSRGAHRRQSL